MISCYIKAYTYQQTNYEEQRLTVSQACRNSATSMPTLGARERLYQPLSLFTYFYLQAVQNSFIYNTEYKLGHKPILIRRSTHDTELKITLGRVCIGFRLCVHVTAFILRNACSFPAPHRSLCLMCMLFVYNFCAYII